MGFHVAGQIVAMSPIEASLYNAFLDSNTPCFEWQGDDDPATSPSHFATVIILYTTVMAMMANHLANDGKIKLNEYSISPFGV